MDLDRESASRLTPVPSVRAVPVQSRQASRAATARDVLSGLLAGIALAVCTLGTAHLYARAAAKASAADLTPPRTAELEVQAAAPRDVSAVPDTQLPPGPAADSPAEIETSEVIDPAAIDSAKEASGDGQCPENMMLVEGQWCPGVAHYCVRWIDERRDRCAEYAPSSRCVGKPVAKRFCIDRYEYPNQAGVKPAIGASWLEAKQACGEIGKRLCTDREWTVACEGPELTPHPYGYMRDETACNIDKPYIFPDDDAMAKPSQRAAEMARLDQSEPSGSRAQCMSAYGVFDMTGNVDEWVVNETGSSDSAPYDSGLKGGYWGPVRNRCRPMTTDHNAWHSGYQIGFRCCADAADTAETADAPSEPEAKSSEGR